MSPPDREPIGVIGVGWVGLVTAACFAEIGHPVIARDVVAEKVASLNRGEVSFHERGLAELLERNRERLTFTTGMDELLAGARLLFVCVDTPPTYSGDADLSRVASVVEELRSDGDHVLIMKSTVPAGTGQAIQRDLADLAYVSCPEFLKEGSAVEDFLHPDRVVIGNEPEDREAGDAVAALYKPLGGEIVRTDVASAEMIKLASNAFLATKISFINEIANVCEEVGADVSNVARGMGLDRRIGPQFLRAGIGYGGSCFSASETLLVRYRGRPRLLEFADLWDLVREDFDPIDGTAVEPADLSVWSWLPGESEPEWMPVSVLTRRNYRGEMIEIRTKMGRRVEVTADHPVIVGDGTDDRILTRVTADRLTEGDWLPLAAGGHDSFEAPTGSIMGAIEDRIPLDQVMVGPGASEIAALRATPAAERVGLMDRPRGVAARTGDIARSGSSSPSGPRLRLDEAAASGMSVIRADLKTARNGTVVPQGLDLGERFWRVLGLYLAEGHISTDIGSDGAERKRISWSFHPRDEHHLAEEVLAYWKSQGVKVDLRNLKTSETVTVSSRILATWLRESLGLGRNSHEQRLPDLIWEQSPARKRALLSGLWEGDGSWSLIQGGSSVILEFGTISDEMADGAARLLADLGIIASWRRGRTRKSTKLTHWLRVSGADQIERAIFLVPERDRRRVRESVAAQSKRISATGHRRFGDRNMAWVRVAGLERRQADEDVYSLEVPGSHTVVASGGLVLSNCFPKDVSALKQLAGNSGYHFQLLNAVIEVNELQKRRVVGKLIKHLGPLAGRRIALLGVAFKPDTDDMREATSLVLSARLKGEGAEVTAFDPVASEGARELLEDVEMKESALEALEGADAAVLVTEWPEFAGIDWTEAASRMRQNLIIDGRNFLDPAPIREAGFTYEGIGRSVGVAE